MVEDVDQDDSDEAETFSEEGPGACISCGEETKNPRETKCRACDARDAEPELPGEED